MQGEKFYQVGIFLKDLMDNTRNVFIDLKSMRDHDKMWAFP